MSRKFSPKYAAKPPRAYGFTLIEIMVAACIFLVLISMAFLTLNTGMNAWFGGSASVEVRNEIVKALNTMGNELKATAPAQTNLPSGGSATSITFHLPQDIDGDGTIINWNGVAPLYEPTIEWSPTTVTYELNASQQVIRRTSQGESRILANNIVGLQFSSPTTQSHIIQINISAQKRDRKGRLVNDAATLMIKMRNS